VKKIIPTNADFLGFGKKYGEAGNLIADVGKNAIGSGLHQPGEEHERTQRIELGYEANDGWTNEASEARIASIL